MATYRVGIGSFNLKDGAVGIGTESTGLGNLKVEGTYKVTDLDVTGVSTFTRYAGFAADNIPINIDRTLTGEHSTLGDIVVGVNSTFTVSTGATVTVGTVESVSIGTHFSPPVGDLTDRPEAPVEGTVRFNNDLNTLEFYNGVEWRQFTVNGASGRGLFNAGSSTATGNGIALIDYVNITSKGNAVYFGELETARRNTSACSSSTRGLFGYGDTGGTYTNSIEYVALASEGNAEDFGDCGPSTNASYNSNCSSSTRGMFNGGYMTSPSPYWRNVIDYVEIPTKGNSIDFGDLYQMAYALASLSSSTRAVMAGGYGSPAAPFSDAVIQHYTISSLGNAVRFGELSHGRWNTSGASNSVRGIVGGGSEPSVTVNKIEYITIASEGNATIFGDLTVSRNGPGACASQTRALFAGGYESPAKRKIIDYVDITTTGNAMDFGDLTEDRFRLGGCSDSHGGLGGY